MSSNNTIKVGDVVQLKADYTDQIFMTVNTIEPLDGTVTCFYVTKDGTVGYVAGINPACLK